MFLNRKKSECYQIFNWVFIIIFTVSLAWDIHSKDSMTQMIIVTDFHPKGSLYDFLQHYTLSDRKLLIVIFKIFKIYLNVKCYI